MSEFFRESQDLSTQDQKLIELYSEIGCSVDSLPYTSEFEELVGKLRAIADFRSRNEILRRLTTLRKAGRLPRLQNFSRWDVSTSALEKTQEVCQPSFFSSREDTENKPVIALNAEYRSARADSPAYSYLTAGYFNSVIDAGGSPVIIPPLKDESSINDILDLFDGIILVGGGDLDPRTDGYMIHSSMRLLDPRRENFDRILVRLVAARKLPVFGIGVGMQLLNVSQGGTLFYHIPEDLPEALPHLDTVDPNHRHALLVEKDSLMDRVYGEGEIRVNSMHHMAIDDVAPVFRATAHCPDGVVEAIESIDPSWFAFGTQFHPESDSSATIDLHLFEEFIAGCNEHTAALKKYCT
jgi:putative glutamine amidotransferase